MQPCTAGELCKCRVLGLWLGASAPYFPLLFKIFSQVNSGAMESAR